MSPLSFLASQLGVPNLISSDMMRGTLERHALFFRSILGMPNYELDFLNTIRLHFGSRRDPSTLPFGSSFPPVPSEARESLSVVICTAAYALLNMEGRCFARRLVSQPYL